MHTCKYMLGYILTVDPCHNMAQHDPGHSIMHYDKPYHSPCSSYGDKLQQPNIVIKHMYAWIKQQQHMIITIGSLIEAPQRTSLL